MKNVEVLPCRPSFRFPIQGAPPLRGWSIQYVSGIDGSERKAGDWLTEWNENTTEITFRFENQLVMCFREEATALRVSKKLREETEIETKVVKVG
jgi:hypothetical protein